MAMDADSFSLLVAEPAELKGWRGPHRKRALWLCAACYRDGMGAEELKATVKNEYGSILVIIGVTLLTTILSWAVQRFLNWWFDKNAAPGALGKATVLADIRKQYGQGK